MKLLLVDGVTWKLVSPLAANLPVFAGLCGPGAHRALGPLHARQLHLPSGNGPIAGAQPQRSSHLVDTCGPLEDRLRLHQEPHYLHQVDTNPSFCRICLQPKLILVCSGGKYEKVVEEEVWKQVTALLHSLFPLLAFKARDEGISYNEYAALFMKGSVPPTSVLADIIPLSQDTLFSLHLIATLAHT